MRVYCPHCDWQDISDFVYGGDACARLMPRPDDHTPWLEHVYRRENPRGEHEELWFHEQGCAQWFEVRRDTRNHRILAVRVCATGAAWRPVGINSGAMA
ncbi:MAG: sarcosine oxidase subunit delta [Pigmentiphaga sp.]